MIEDLADQLAVVVLTKLLGDRDQLDADFAGWSGIKFGMRRVAAEG
jgi:hypothetical protein